jgi:hypothetical protein
MSKRQRVEWPSRVNLPLILTPMAFNLGEPEKVLSPEGVPIGGAEPGQEERLARSPRRHGGFLAIDQSLEPGLKLSCTKIKKVAEPQALSLSTPPWTP